jgi:tRNA(fMet)-specific endonuclease VapC
LTPTLAARLEASGQDIATTIVNVEEAMRGWLAEIHRYASNTSRQSQIYARLGKLIVFFSEWNMLAFDAEAVAGYEALRRQRLRSIGTNDLKIAAITLHHNATLLSANLRHFNLVPGLRVEDWIGGVM